MLSSALEVMWSIMVSFLYFVCMVDKYMPARDFYTWKMLISSIINIIEALFVNKESNGI